MIERLLRERPRKVGPSKTAVNVILTIHQWFSHRPGMKCVHANPCPWQSANPPCTSSCSSENCHNRGPTWNPPPGGRQQTRAYLRLTVNVDQIPRRTTNPPDPLPVHSLGRIAPTRTYVLAQRHNDQRGVACPTGSRQILPHGPSAHRDCHPQQHLTSNRWEQKDKL